MRLNPMNAPPRVEMSLKSVPAQKARKNDAAPADAIGKRAYEIFISRGGEHGHDVADWLAAEAELSAGTGRE